MCYKWFGSLGPQRKAIQIMFVWARFINECFCIDNKSTNKIKLNNHLEWKWKLQMQLFT